MVGGIFARCGAFAGAINKMNENAWLRELSIMYLRHNKSDETGQFPILNPIDLPVSTDWQEKVMSRWIRQGMEPNEQWMYKDFRLLLTFPQWLEAFPKAKWIIVRRSDDDILHSCINTGYMNAFNDARIRNIIGVQTTEEGWQWWINRHKTIIGLLKMACPNVKEVYPQQMVEGDFSQIKEIVEWTGLEWNEQKVQEYILPQLWKSIQKQK